MIEAHVAQLGFRIADVKILLNTQAHFDHAGGFAELKRASGARLIVSEQDARSSKPVDSEQRFLDQLVSEKRR